LLLVAELLLAMGVLLVVLEDVHVIGEVKGNALVRFDEECLVVNKNSPRNGFLDKKA
jgi:hypothetical protein